MRDRCSESVWPIHSYEAFRSDIERIRRRGKKTSFGQVAFSILRSHRGTASAGKIVPLSEEMLMINRRFTLTVALAYRGSNAALQNSLGVDYSPFPVESKKTRCTRGSMIGEVSGLQFLFAPWLIKRLYQAVPESILFLPNWGREARCYCRSHVKNGYTGHSDGPILGDCPL